MDGSIMPRIDRLISLNIAFIIETHNSLLLSKIFFYLKGRKSEHCFSGFPQVLLSSDKSCIWLVSP